MEVTALVFSSSVGMIFLISGLLKLLSLKEASTMVVDMDIIPEKLARIIGILTPFFEIGIAILLVLKSSSIFVNLIAVFVLSIFTLINASAIYENKPKNCYCFGTLIESKTGYGGLIQSLALLIFLLPNFIINKKTNAIDILMDTNGSIITTLFLLITVVFYTLTLMFIRNLYDLFIPMESTE